MEFIQITKDGIAGVATVPVTALPHWEGYGWRQVSDAEPDSTSDSGLTSAHVKPVLQHIASRRGHAATESTEE